MCLAQGHNAVTLVRLEPADLRYRVKHSTTEPLRSLLETVSNMERILATKVTDRVSILAHDPTGIR